jgi:isopenicillin N synthase-like dioxygenase
MNTIPVVDLSQYTHGNDAAKNKFVQALGTAYEEVGFVAVVNHGIPNALIKQLYEQVEAFFSLTENQKKQYEKIALAGQRGYTSFGREHAKGFDAPDLKEFFQFGQIIEDGEQVDEFYPDNVFVNELPEFTHTLEQAYRAFEQSGKALLEAIALFLNLDQDFFAPEIHNGNSILRAIHYPPITQEPKSSIRAEQHEDINLITLLVGASAEGLQVLNKQEEWVNVQSSDDQIVVNVGDMLQRLTNNRLKSTTHRVVNPPKEKWHTHRYSIPFFLHPKGSMSLACLPSCINDAHPKQYEDYSAAQYLDERLREIGLKK